MTSHSQQPASPARPQVEGDRARTKQILLQVLRKKNSASARELADVLDVSVQAVRRHLKDLEGEGAISHESVSTGAGRPQHVYHLTEKGSERFPRHYDEFALSFLTAMKEQVGTEAVEQVLHSQWQQKAADYRAKVGEGSLGDRIAKLADLRTREGYMVDWRALESSQTNESACRYIFTEYNCAISQVAESFPSVCTHELDMLAAIFPDCKVERTHWMVGNEHRCGYQIGAV
ncbi:MAG: iron-sulfur cluster biosynthesis transcriptional regulator SufR [Cyanobacteria bacterium J06639_1]